MQTTFVSQTQPTQTEQQKNYQAMPKVLPSAEFVFVLQLTDGKFVIGQANNVAKRICAINSGMNKLVPGAMRVYKIVGIKDQTPERTLPIVVNKFCRKHGDDNVIVV